VALWGCGRWGRHILRDLRELGARVTVVAASEESRRNAAEGGAAAIVDVLDAAGPDLDGVVIATPAHHHAEAILAAAAVGCPIFCEKPLTRDLAREAEIMNACGERLFVMHKWRWHPGVERLAELAGSGGLGEVTAVRSTRLGWGDRHVGADSIDTLASHDLSIGLGILGSLPPVRAARGTPWPGDRAGGWVELTVLMGEGARSLVVDVSAVSAHRLRRIEVTGTLGSAVLPEPEAAALELRRHAGELDPEAVPERVPLEREWPLRRALRDFLEHCRGGPPPRAGASEGFAVVRRMLDLRAALGGPS
jgi:predicted dehydrogenase